MNWYECKLAYEKEENRNGKFRRVTEVYLQDADSFISAETRLAQNLKGYPPYTVESIRKLKFAEFFRDSTADRYYKAKVGFISLDEKSGTEKKKYVNMLLQAAEIKGAITLLEKGMANSIMDYEVAAVSETSIMDVFES